MSDVIKCNCSQEAVSWCVECSEFICNDCVQAHKRIKTTKNHQISELIEQLHHKKDIIKCNCSLEAVSWCSNCLEFICIECVEAHKRIKTTKNHGISLIQLLITKNAYQGSDGSLGHRNVGLTKESNGKALEVTADANENYDSDVSPTIISLSEDSNSVAESNDKPDYIPKPEDIPYTPTAIVEKTKRSIKWISSGETFTPSKYVWNRVFKDNVIDPIKWKYYKNEIGQQFDRCSKSYCVLILNGHNVAKKYTTLRGKCSHPRCRKYKLICMAKDIVEGQAPTFLVYFSKVSTNHTKKRVRQARGSLRDKYKQSLKNSLPATFTRTLVSKIDDNLYENNNCDEVYSDDVVQKMRSEVTLSQDFAKDDYNDMTALQDQTKDDPFIQKVISPYAVYVHSKIQYQVLHQYHQRKKEHEEVIGFLDATGGVAYVTPSTSKHPILYYPLLINVKGDETDRFGTLIPISECINSGHGVIDIAGWLHNLCESFIKYNSQIIPIFDRVISDFSYANFHGILHSFQTMRLQQYIYISYRFAVHLTDFSELKHPVKIQMCSTHLSNTFAEFVRRFYPSPVSNKKTTTEQKYIIEVFCALIICKCYNVIKEIFRNLCIVVLSEYNSSDVQRAKQKIFELTQTDILMTTRDKLKTKFKYDTILQDEIDVMSENESVYDYNSSILKLPIYKGSQFYRDLKYIQDSFEVPYDDDEEKEIEENRLYNDQILTDFMKQFGGILPFWTGITVPEGIEKYNNQSAESHMNITKSLLSEKQLEVGQRNVKATRFISLMRNHIVSDAKRYLSKIPRRGQNQGIRKHKPKDASKVAKKVASHIKSVAARKSILELPELNIQQVESSLIPETIQQVDSSLIPETIQQVESSLIPETIQQAKESWNKRPNYQNRKKRFSYFLRTTIATSQSATIINKSEITKKPSSGKRSASGNKYVAATKSTSNKKSVAARKNSNSKAPTQKRASNSIIPKISNGLIKNRRMKKPEVAKKIVSHIKSVVARKAILELPEANLEETIQQVESSSRQSQLPESDILQVESLSKPESLQEASEPWSKKPNSRTTSNILKKTIATSESATIINKSQITKKSAHDKKSTSGKKYATATKSTSGKKTSTTTKSTIAPTRKKVSDSTVSMFANGLIKNPNYYLQPWPTYVVAKIDNSALPIEDYKTLLKGVDVSIKCMNYIMEFILSASMINLTKFANYIVDGKDTLPFSIVNKICYMPYYNGQQWTLYIINTTKCRYSLIDPFRCHSNDLSNRFENFFAKFIADYNGGSHNNKLKPIEQWKEIPFHSSYKVVSTDSGVYIIHCAYLNANKILNDSNYDPDDLREKLLSEVLQFSDYVTNLCVKCGEEVDNSTSKFINSTKCVRCLRRNHDLCLSLDYIPNQFTCPLCENAIFEDGLVKII